LSKNFIEGTSQNILWFTFCWCPCGYLFFNLGYLSCVIKGCIILPAVSILYTQIIYLLFLHPQITYLDCILSISFPIKILVITASNRFFHVYFIYWTSELFEFMKYKSFFAIVLSARLGVGRDVMHAHFFVSIAISAGSKLTCADGPRAISNGCTAPATPCDNAVQAARRSAHIRSVSLYVFCTW
jgi:hypothetical protein